MIKHGSGINERKYTDFSLKDEDGKYKFDRRCKELMRVCGNDMEHTSALQLRTHAALKRRDIVRFESQCARLDRAPRGHVDLRDPHAVIGSKTPSENRLLRQVLSRIDTALKSNIF